MKLTKKQIEAIIAHTPAELKNTPCTLSEILGYYMPSGANWSYQAGWNYDGQLVVIRFGSIM